MCAIYNIRREFLKSRVQEMTYVRQKRMRVFSVRSHSFAYGRFFKVLRENGPFLLRVTYKTQTIFNEVFKYYQSILSNY